MMHLDLEMINGNQKFIFLKIETIILQVKEDHEFLLENIDSNQPTEVVVEQELPHSIKLVFLLMIILDQNISILM